MRTHFIRVCVWAQARTKHVFGAFACIAALGSVEAIAAAAVDSYPYRPIRLVVTFIPGGPTEIIARTLAVKLQEDWGQPVVVDNRPGAGGNLGTDLVAKATPDGHTLVLGSVGPLAISPHVYAKLTALMALPEIRQRFQSIGTDPATDNTPEQFAAFIRSERRKWEAPIKSSGVKAD